MLGMKCHRIDLIVSGAKVEVSRWRRARSMHQVLLPCGESKPGREWVAAFLVVAVVVVALRIVFLVPLGSNELQSLSLAIVFYRSLIVRFFQLSLRGGGVPHNSGCLEVTGAHIRGASFQRDVRYPRRVRFQDVLTLPLSFKSTPAVSDCINPARSTWERLLTASTRFRSANVHC